MMIFLFDLRRDKPGVSSRPDVVECGGALERGRGTDVSLRLRALQGAPRMGDCAGAAYLCDRPWSLPR